MYVYRWMNLIMTSRRDVTGVMVRIRGIIPGRMMTTIFRLVNYYTSAIVNIVIFTNNNILTIIMNIWLWLSNDPKWCLIGWRQLGYWANGRDHGGPPPCRVSWGKLWLTKGFGDSLFSDKRNHIFQTHLGERKKLGTPNPTNIFIFLGKVGRWMMWRGSLVWFVQKQSTPKNAATLMLDHWICG